MMRHVLLLLLFATSLRAQVIDPQCSNPGLAERFYPSSLDAQYRRGMGEDAAPYRQTCAELLANGQIVAAFSNGFSSVLALINGDQIASQTTIDSAEALLQLEELTGDRAPEIIVTAHNNARLSTWIFTVADSALRNIGPMVHDPYAGDLPLLTMPHLVDVTGDGVPELLNPTAKVNAFMTYVWRKGAYAAQATPFWQVYAREAGEPVTVTDSFSATPGRYTLRILTREATAGEVVLNGTILITPGDLKRKNAVIEVPVVMRENNEISTELRGEPGVTLTLVLLQ